MSDYRENLADELAIDRGAPRLTTNTEPPADVKRLIQKAKFEVAALHNEGRPELAQFIARMGEALLSAQPAPSQSGLVEMCQICVGEAVISHSYGIAQNGWRVECAKDMESGDGSHSTGLFATEAEALQAWRTNNQPAPDNGVDYMASNNKSRKNSIRSRVIDEPELAAEDIRFLIRQLKKMEHAQDRAGIAKIAKRYGLEWY